MVQHGNPKAIAAVAGVLSYLQARQDGLGAQRVVTGAAGAAVPGAGPSPWALFGRQRIMVNRSRLQRRRKP